MVPEGSKWWELYTLDSSDIPRTTHLPFSSASSVSGTADKREISVPMLNRDDKIRRWRKHGNCVLNYVIAKERDYVAVMSVGSPGGVLWHVVCPKLDYALPEASHLTRFWPGIINRHFALLSQESDCRPSAFRDALTERLFVVHWVEWCPSDDAMYSHPSSLSVLPLVSRFIAGIFLLSIRSIQGFCVGVISFWCSVVRCGGDPRMCFCPVSSCHTRHGRLQILQS